MGPLRALCLSGVVTLVSACGGGDPPAAGPPLGDVDLASGQEAMRAGQYAVAEDLFQRAYVRGADPAESLLWQARSEVALGTMEPARVTLIRLLDLSPAHIAARALQVRLDLLLGEYEDAFKHLALLERAAPQNDATALLKAELPLALGLATRAEAAVTAGRAAHPGLPEWPFHAAQIDLMRGWLDAARGAYLAAAREQQSGLAHAREAWLSVLIGEPGHAERAYLDAAVQAKREPLPFSLSADFYASLGRFDEAVTDLANMERVSGRGSPDLTRRVSGVLVRTGRLANAEKLMKPYLQRRVDDRTTARELALAYLLGGKDTEAAATLEVLSLKDRESGSTQYLTGAARLRIGDSARAQTAFQEAERLDGNRLPVDLALGATALRNHDWFDAEFQARRRLERAPDDWLAGMLWAAARKYQGQIPAARAIQNRLVERFPERAADIHGLMSLPPAPTDGEVSPENLPARLLDRLLPPRAVAAPSETGSSPPSAN